MTDMSRGEIWATSLTEHGAMLRRSASKLTALAARIAAPMRGSAPSASNPAAATLAASRGAGSTWVGAVGGARAVSFGALLAPRGGFARPHHPWIHQHRRSIFIQTQTTPNPASLMFMPGKPVYTDGGTKNFANPREGMASPLAKKLFLIDGVTAVFFGQDFVTVTKSEDHEWGVLKPEVFAAVMDFYASGEPIISDEAEQVNAGTAIHEDDDEIVAMIKELLETRIRPAVAEDGGDIVFKGWDADTGVVTVKMQGACDGCPSSSVTLKSGIENMLRHYVPEVNSVEQEVEEGEGMDLLDMATMNR